MRLEDWLLTASERGNDVTEIDRRRCGGAAWTTGNEVTVRVDGAAYYTRLVETLGELSAGASVWFTDWEGNADERLAGPGSEVGLVLGDLVRRGVHVRGLLWRSHPRAAHFAEQDNMHLARDINRQGGVLALDERVRRGGSHHQKLIILRRGRRRLNSAAEPGAGPTDVGVRRWHRPLPRSQRQPHACRGSAARAARPPVRQPTPVARHPARGPGPGRRRPVVHVPRTMGATRRRSTTATRCVPSSER